MESSSLTQRRPQAEPVAESKDTPSPVQPAVKAPRQPLRQLLAWFRVHPEVALGLVTLVIGLSLMRSFATPSSGPVVFERETLKLYNGKKNAPMYLAILGEVFDVTKGRRHYDADKGYGGFIGRDASRAFVSGDFSERGLVDDIRDFTPEQYKALVEWRAFYRKEYTFKGRLVGPFYNADGKPNRLLKKVEEGAATAKSEEDLQRELEAQWPACNVRWTESGGGTVWCDADAYPRKVFQQLPGGKPTTRCACFQELGWSDIRQVYPDCAPDAHSCKV